MKARKGNKVYRITENDKKRYLGEGFDIYNDEGEILEYSPQKTVSYNEYKKLEDRIKELEDKIKELETVQQEKKATGRKTGD